MSKHTPGPWQAEATGVQPGAFTVVGDGSQMVALVYGATREQQRANADLVTSVLDMQAALHAAINWFTPPNDSRTPFPLKQIADALAKSEASAAIKPTDGDGP